MSRNESTAVVSVVTPEKTIVSKCGDSRDVLCRDGVATSRWAGYYWDVAKVLGVLAMSRAIVMDYGTLYQMRRRYGMARVCPRGTGRADGDDSVAAATHNACSDASLLLTKLALARPTFDNEEEEE
uniref:Serine/threonine phosphatase n=1 Tax=Arabidopsis cebennensis TaxID=97979 RepID=B2BY04_9BRAS|nr:serine/threonine phosphatase [Arabidopsis cebennensis]